jgi:phenylacetic acid degradation operon negative regulatory protein
MRLKKQKLVEIDEEEGIQVVKITEAGRRRILKYAIDELAIKKPKFWDGRWTLVSYDIPEDMSWQRDTFRDYLRAWGFFPLEKSVFLHAYPCQKEIEFLREYLGIGEYVNIFTVSRIEKDRAFRKYFGI